MIILRLLLIGALILIYGIGTGFTAEKETENNNIFIKIIEKTVGKNKIIKMDPIEPSHISGWKQRKVWVDSPYGERPYLIYVLEDKNLYFIGSVFDAEGKNLTELNVGKIVPKTVKEEEMLLNDEYRIGQKDAKVKVTLWLGIDLSAKFIFERFFDIYEKNKDTVSIYFKFFPRGEKEYNRMKVLTCFKGESFFSAYKTLLNAVPGWGSPEDIEAFKEARGMKGKECDESLIKKDLALATKLNLPGLPVAFINGQMLLETITTENLNKIYGIQLN